jgi:chitodextrinase
VTLLDGAGTRRRLPRARGFLSGALALLVLALSAAVTGGPTALPAPELRLASTANPAPPTNVSPAAADRALTISWSAPGEAFISGYRVYLDGTLVASPAGTSATVTGLVNGRGYSITVLTVTNFLGSTSVGTTGSTPVIGTPKDSVAPAAPTAVTAVRGDGQVALSWTPNAADYDADGYRVVRDGVPLTGLLIGAGTGSYLDTTVTNDVTYGYAVQTHDTSGNWSSSSAPVASATPTDLTAPATPTGLVGGRGDGRAGLLWDPNAEPDLASYRVLRDGVEIATLTGTTYLDLGRTNDTTYGYTLVAVDTHGNRSAPSAVVPVTPTDLTPPDAPSGLVAARGDGQVTLSWNPNTEPDLAGYRVVRNLVEIATVTGGTGYVDQGLTNDTDYTYTVVAVDSHGNRSVSSAPDTATPTDLGAPATPTGLVATPGDGQVSLSWTANAETDVSTYRVLRDGVEIVGLSGTGYVDAGLTNDRTYSYTLVAVDTHGNHSLPSSAAPATPTDLTAPAVPTGLGVTRANGKSVLAWTANTEPDLASYRVLRDGVEIATVTGTSFTDTQANGAARSYSLVAVDTHGNRSAASAPRSSAIDTTPPAAPTGLAAIRGDSLVTLSWAANTEPDLATYRVLRGGVEIATVTGGGYVDTGLTNDVTYTYTLVAVDYSNNRSAPSVPATTTPTDLTPPAAPAAPSAVAGERQVSLSWAANTEPDLASYRVLRDGVEICTVTALTFVETGLTNDTRYSYTLAAVDDVGNRSAASSAVPATPVDGPPAPPAGVTATPGDRRAVVGWTPPSDADVVGYRVLAQNGTTVLATATAPAAQAAVNGLTNGTAYRFAVVAVDAGGHVSAPSALSGAVTPVSPTVPTTGAGESGGLAVSADGRYVVVGTRAALEAADTNSAYELYLVDRTAGTARRIAPLAASATGATDPTNTAAPVISADGRSVVLATSAALAPGDTNALADVYRYDTTARTWSLVSVPAGGTVNGSTPGAVLQTGSSVYATSPPVAMSADGDLVLFYSARPDLVAGDTNGFVDLFAKRISTGVVTRVSTTTAGGNLAGAATGPALALTPDGRFALFPAATASGAMLLYRKTLSGTGAGELVVVSSVTVSGRATQFAVYRDAGDIDLSDDGRYVALVTAAQITTATPGTLGSTGQAYRLDATTGSVVALGNGQQTVWEHQVELDPTGRYAFFASSAAELPVDTNGHTDHYRRDLSGGVAGPLILVTTDAGGGVTTGPIGSIAPTEYGRLLALTGDRVVVSTSQGLVSADTNRLRDVYEKDLVSGLVSSPLG